MVRVVSDLKGPEIRDHPRRRGPRRSGDQVARDHPVGAEEIVAAGVREGIAEQDVVDGAVDEYGGSALRALERRRRPRDESRYDTALRAVRDPRDCAGAPDADHVPNGARARVVAAVTRLDDVDRAVRRGEEMPRIVEIPCDHLQRRSRRRCWKHCDQGSADDGANRARATRQAKDQAPVVHAHGLTRVSMKVSRTWASRSCWKPSHQTLKDRRVSAVLGMACREGRRQIVGSRPSTIPLSAVRRSCRVHPASGSGYVLRCRLAEALTPPASSGRPGSAAARSPRARRRAPPGRTRTSGRRGRRGRG